MLDIPYGDILDIPYGDILDIPYIGPVGAAWGGAPPLIVFLVLREDLRLAISNLRAEYLDLRAFLPPRILIGIFSMLFASLLLLFL